MTRRERLEAKVERRREWAAGRLGKAARLRSYTDQYRGDTAFNTQPGHIPERAKVIRMIDQVCEHVQMAEHHEAKADGLADQLNRSVFSDDVDAIAQLEARIAEHEAKRDRMKQVNALYKKDDAGKLAALGIDLEALKAKLVAAGPYWGSKPHLAYELTNLGARIRSDRERIDQIKARQSRSTQAEQAGGVLIETKPEWNGYCRVTFAEKPDRVTVDALKGGGFQWGAGGWSGQYDRLPAGIDMSRHISADENDSRADARCGQCDRPMDRDGFLCRACVAEEGRDHYEDEGGRG